MEREEFVKMVEKARALLASKTPIRGWGLNEPPAALRDWFVWVPVGPSEGCTEGSCPHYGHDPAAPQALWVPVDGVTVVEMAPDEGRLVCRYFAAVKDGREVALIQLEQVEGENWAVRAREITLDDAPPTWVLARFSSSPRPLMPRNRR